MDGFWDFEDCEGIGGCGGDSIILGDVFFSEEFLLICRFLDSKAISEGSVKQYMCYWRN